MKNIFTNILTITKYLLAVAVLAFGVSDSFAQIKEIPYTLDDRDRLIRVEEQIKSLREEMNVKFSAMDTKFSAMDKRFEAMDDKINKLYTLIYFVLGGVFGLIGLILWDRRSYIKPVKQDIEELRNVLHRYAEKNPEFKEILNKAAL